MTNLMKHLMRIYF